MHIVAYARYARPASTRHAAVRKRTGARSRARRRSSVSQAESCTSGSHCRRLDAFASASTVIAVAMQPSCPQGLRELRPPASLRRQQRAHGRPPFAGLSSSRSAVPTIVSRASPRTEHTSWRATNGAITGATTLRSVAPDTCARREWPASSITDQRRRDAPQARLASVRVLQVAAMGRPIARREVSALSWERHAR